MDWGGGTGQGIATTIADLGRIRADQALAQGRIWGNTLANLGQTIGTTIAQAPQRAALEQERQARALELQSVAQDNALKVQTAQRLDAGRQQLAGLLKQYTDPTTGEVNDSAVAGQLTDPDIQAGYLKNIQTRQAIRETAQKASDLADAAQAKNFDTIATILHSSPDAASAQAALQDVVQANPKNPILRQMVTELTPNLQLWGDDYARHAQSLWNVSPSGRAAAAEAEKARAAAQEKGYEIPPGGAVSLPGATPGAPRTTITGPPERQTQPTEYTSFQRAWAKTAAGTDKTWEDLTPQQQLAGIEKFKTYSTDATATAAANRQAATIQAQIDQQARSQAFTEAQAGRNEYQNKVAQPYQTAVTSAQELRDFVAAAKAGNKEAANLQNLQATMSTIRSNGLNRINTTELGVPASAGSLWDRVVGRVGSLKSGQPVPADLQEDLNGLADLLEKSATVKYQRGRQSVVDTYRGVSLPDETVTATPPSGGAKKRIRYDINGNPVP